MKRLLQLLLVAAWIAGAVLGGITEPPPAQSTEPGTLYRVVDTQHAQVEITPDHVVLTIASPWDSEWRVAAPAPPLLRPSRTQPSPDTETPRPPALLFSLIHALAPHP